MGDGGGGWVFPAITLCQPNYSYGCFVVGVLVVVELGQINVDRTIQCEIKLMFAFTSSVHTYCFHNTMLSFHS